MKFGLDVGTYGQLATPENVLSLTRCAEEADFESVWLADHVVFPEDIKSQYPYSPTGAFPVAGTEPLLEAIATMGVLVGATRRVKIGTAVLVMPYRNPLLLAKMLVTYDQFSGGRIILGAGVGWLREEFEALATAPFSQRGRVTDEYLALFKQACQGGRLVHSSDHYQLDPVSFVPGSLQKPHIPIVIGGTTNRALQRVARYGDGWMSVAVPMEQMASRLQVLRDHCEREQRSVDDLRLYHKLFVSIGSERESVHGGREPGTGSVAQIVDDILQLQAFGFSGVIVRFFGTDPGQQQDRLKQFTGQVMSRIQPSDRAQNS